MHACVSSAYPYLHSFAIDSFLLLLCWLLENSVDDHVSWQSIKCLSMLNMLTSAVCICVYVWCVRGLLNMLYICVYMCVHACISRCLAQYSIWLSPIFNYVNRLASWMPTENKRPLGLTCRNVFYPICSIFTICTLFDFHAYKNSI